MRNGRRLDFALALDRWPGGLWVLWLWLVWRNPFALDQRQIYTVLAWISHAREKISPLVGISESDQTISGEKL
jgi:uncharacterized protein YaeQ